MPAPLVAGMESQSFSYADTAIEKLQKLTGKNFGYHPADSDASPDTGGFQPHQFMFSPRVSMWVKSE